MKNNDFSNLQNIYSLRIETKNGIKFTPREIDIIACTLGSKSTKKIASLVSISPRTVENHIHNIKVKLGCSSRENIIDSIEKSGNFLDFKKHYLNLLIKNTFELQLKEIFRLVGSETPICYIINWSGQEKNSVLISQLEKHLILAGIKTSIEDIEEAKISAYSVNNIDTRTGELLEQLRVGENLKNLEISLLIFESIKTPFKVLVLLLGKNKNDALPKEFFSIEYVDFSVRKNYYFSVLQVLKKCLSIPNMDQIIKEFTCQHQATFGSPISSEMQDFAEGSKLEKEKQFFIYYFQYILHKIRWRFCLAISFSFFLFFLLFFILNENKEDKSKVPQHKKLIKNTLVRSDLIIPNDPTFLHRPELLSQIGKQLKEQNGIQAIAIVGIGGSGKTTIARQYARQQQANVVWEINAETHESLKRSFENLADALVKTKEDKNTLRELQEIKDPQKKEEGIIRFVKEKLKIYSDWFLIYDNVEKFSDVQKYFPRDLETWGIGKVIITTRDSNIQNNSHIGHLIQTRELDGNEKFNLFAKIMSHGGAYSFSATQKKQAIEFLEKIPPFPLDITIAAYYLKSTNIPYSEYLSFLKENKKDFESIQKTVLKEVSDYTKTRFGIITLSLTRLINTQKDFGDLLLFMSLLDSQNIPRALLNGYTSNLIVDSFIYNLKKYSLITNESLSFSPSLSTLSIHRSTQEIILAYFMKALNLENNKKLLQPFANALKEYMADAISRENLSQIKLLVNHCETLLNHHNLLTNNMKGSIGGELGYAYYFLSDYKKAINLLEQSINNFDQFSRENLVEKAHNLVHLGDVYSELPNFKKAKNLFEKALLIYSKSPENDLEIARALACLGNSSRRSGDYENAKNLLEQSLKIYKKYPENHIGRTHCLTYLGIVYEWLGNYENAKILLEQSLKNYKKYLIEDHFRVAWVLVHLGKVYKKLGHHEKARDLFEEGLFIFKKQFSERHVRVAWTLTILGDIYNNLGQFKKAKKLSEQSLKLAKELCGQDNLRTFWALLYLGKIHINLGDYEKAKNFFEKVLVGFDKHYVKDYVENAEIIRNLGKIYLLEGSIETAENFLYKASQILQNNNHPDHHMVLEDLSELNLKKSLLAMNKGEMQQSQRLKTQAISCLSQALEIVTTHFPKDSPHITRIQSKLKNIEQR